MNIPEILHCDTCHKNLDEFEIGKWNALVDYWGGKTGSRKPKCRSCYMAYIQQAQRKATL